MLACVHDHIEFSKVIVDEENMFKFKDSSLPEKSRDLVLHEGDLNLSNYSWQFGRTPAHLGTIGSSNLDEFLEKHQTAFDPLPRQGPCLSIRIDIWILPSDTRGGVNILKTSGAPKILW